MRLPFLRQGCWVGGGGTGEEQGVWYHFRGCTLAHEEQAQEALADPSYRHRQTETDSSQ